MASQLIFLAVVTSLATAENGTVDGERYRPQSICPDKCRCSRSHTALDLAVDCRGRPDIDPEQLTEQLDSLLSSNLTYGHLTSLSIVNAELPHVPRSVCRLATLTELHLGYNRLARLPDNCLTNLTALTSFTASYNTITELQDGLFDGLHELELLKIDHNQISSIGLRVFNISAGLTNLRQVILQNNRLEVLEPWPFFVSRSTKPGLHGVIDLQRNSIRRFSNTIGWTPNCETDGGFLDLNLGHNSITRLSDFLVGFNLSIWTWMCFHHHRKFRVHFRSNYIRCDCIDYDIFKISAAFTYSRVLDGVYCGKPEAMYASRVTSVPLEEFVCEVTERCPAGCRCVHRPANATLHVYCSNTNLAVLPLELPQLPKSYTRYKLDFSNNRLLRRLEHRDYFVNSSILDVSNCGIERVDNWTDVFRFKSAYLHGNRLTTLPRSVLAQNISAECTTLSLYNNPWRCSCEDKWMVKWLTSTSEHLVNPSAITCASPKKLINMIIPQIPFEEFCVDPVTGVGVRKFALSSVAVVIIVGLESLSTV